MEEERRGAEQPKHLLSHRPVHLRGGPPQALPTPRLPIPWRASLLCCAHTALTLWRGRPPQTRGPTRRHRRRPSSRSSTAAARHHRAGASRQGGMSTRAGQGRGAGAGQGGGSGAAVQRRDDPRSERLFCVPSTALTRWSAYVETSWRKSASPLSSGHSKPRWQKKGRMSSRGPWKIRRPPDSSCTVVGGGDGVRVRPRARVSVRSPCLRSVPAGQCGRQR